MIWLLGAPNKWGKQGTQKLRLRLPQWFVSLTLDNQPLYACLSWLPRGQSKLYNAYKGLGFPKKQKKACTQRTLNHFPSHLQKRSRCWILQKSRLSSEGQVCSSPRSHPCAIGYKLFSLESLRVKEIPVIQNALKGSMVCQPSKREEGDKAPFSPIPAFYMTQGGEKDKGAFLFSSFLLSSGSW